MVAATNEDLWALVQQGRFRQDLYCRLSVHHVLVPSLAERREDMASLVQALMERRAERKQVTEDAIAAMQAMRWPGNVRQLATIVARIAAYSDASVVDAAELRRLGLLDEAVPQRPCGRTLREQHEDSTRTWTGG